jgi:signal transduction histidine kinase
MGFRSIFEHAPFAAARCDRQGAIVEMNSAFRQILDPESAGQGCLQLYDLVPAEDRRTTESLFRELLDSARDSIHIAGKDTSRAAIKEGRSRRATIGWTAWREPETGGEPSHAFLIAEPGNGPISAEEGLLQSQRWEAIGRLAGGVVHDFNNLLTGIMLYCDLLLSSLDAHDGRRRYADEIRFAIMQAAGLVRQLLVFARPQACQVRTLCLNQIALALQVLLIRLIGENIALEFNLEPDLGLVRMDPSQVQQILLNLILNGRDALPDGGRIVVQTSNCEFQRIPRAVQPECGGAAFPCVLLAISDNGCGMDSKTREHLFDPFFTTKSAGKGTGLGLTTVRSIVTTNGGLMHVESEAGRGTRVMVLLPTASNPAAADFPGHTLPHPELSPTSLQEIKKESLL